MRKIVALKSCTNPIMNRSHRISRLLVLGLLLVHTLPLGAQAPSDRQMLFDMLYRLEQLEREIRQLRGDVELARHQQEAASQRLQALEEEIAASSSSAPTSPPVAPTPTSPSVTTLPPVTTPPVVAPPGPPPVAATRPTLPPTTPASPTPPPTPAPVVRATPPSAGEQADYQTAFDQLRQGAYDAAIQGFQAFLTRYPASPLAASVQYWLGETYYVTRDFERAKNAFIDLGVNYPESDRLPEAMWRLGLVYEELGDKTKAREVLQKLLQTYPDTQVANAAAQRLRSLR